MKSLLIHISLVLGVIAVPQRGGSCPCPDVICPKYGRDACECMNRAAQDCYRMWVQARNPSCSQPTPLNCNGPPQRPPPNSQSRPPVSGQTSFTTFYSVVPYRTTITTTLPGFGWPNPVTSYSYSMSTTTITLINPPGGPPNSQWTQGQPWPWNQQTQPGNSHRTTTVTIGPSKGPSRPPISNPPYNPGTTTITITAGQPTGPSLITPTPITPPWSVSTSTVTSTVPWARSSDEPWSVPPKPPPGFTPGQSSVAPEPTTSKPAPWRPPPVSGGSWTPISDPTLPVNPVNTPVFTPTGASKPTQSIPSPTATLGPIPPLPAEPAKCGPGAPKCVGNTYCDPQPLCSIGEDCPGVCLPILAMDFVNNTQPWEVRRQVWQGLLDKGEFVMYKWIS